MLLVPICIHGIMFTTGGGSQMGRKIGTILMLCGFDQKETILAVCSEWKRLKTGGARK